MHLAALLGVPTIAIFGSTEPRLTRPLGPNHIILRHHVECSPCFLRKCPIDFRCMKAVSVDEVVDSVLSMLGQRATENGDVYRPFALRVVRKFNINFASMEVTQPRIDRSAGYVLRYRHRRCGS